MDYDRTPLPEVYVEARTLDAATLSLWADALGRLVGTSGPRPVVAVDLGCGTGRFSEVVATAFGARVIGVDPSLRMLARRPPSAPGAFVAARAETLPFAAGSIDLVFMSMVYHHLEPGAGLREVRRVLAQGGRAIVRTATRELLDHYLFMAFFPEARTFDMARMPSRQDLAAAFDAAGFTPVARETVWQHVARDPGEYVRKIARRGLSGLQAIPDEAFGRGLRALEAHCATLRSQEAFREPIDLVMFRRSD